MNEAKHTKGPSCGCCLEPVDDIRDACDLCSEATGMNDGVGWRIRRCKLHEAAPDLLEVLRNLIETARAFGGYHTSTYLNRDAYLHKSWEAMMESIARGRELVAKAEGK